ncbi:MAG: Gfo/Idh/MocA family oxidoreductase [Calditrichaceae bacterium]
MKRFALIGAAGYIAPRHMQAIKDTGNQLVAALDPADSVGILDRYFDDVDFFTEFERFDRHIEMLRRKAQRDQIDYVSICSPNYLHDAHIRFALRVGSDAVCEKPLVLNPWNLDGLQDIEEDSGQKIYNILQLRVHPEIIKLKVKREKEKEKVKGKNEKADIVLTYITSRGKWYHYSWKGQLEKSGGVATNIGIHFFDMLMWIFGKTQRSEVHYADSRKVSGFLELENANVRWYLSLDKTDLPENAVKEGKTTYRSILIDGAELEFSGGFTDLHTVVYRNILNGNGYGLNDARPSIELAHQIRFAIPKMGEAAHPLLKVKGKR